MAGAPTGTPERPRPGDSREANLSLFFPFSSSNEKVVEDGEGSPPCGTPEGGSGRRRRVHRGRQAKAVSARPSPPMPDGGSRLLGSHERKQG